MEPATYGPHCYVDQQYQVYSMSHAYFVKIQSHKSLSVKPKYAIMEKVSPVLQHYKGSV